MRTFLLAALASALSASAAEPTIKFDDVTKKAGIYEWVAGIMGHGGAWGDFDGDGRIDIFVGGFCDRPNSEYAPANGPVPNRMFRNKGDGTFERVAQPVLEYYGRTSGAVFADLDNDGIVELYAANNAKGKAGRGEDPQKSAPTILSKMFKFPGGKAVEITNDCGACPPALLTARNIGVFDYDGDGLLDLYVVEDIFRKQPSRSALFRNLGNLKFEDVTKKAGLPENVYGLGLAVADLNNDLRPDIFVPHSNRLFLSKGDGTYREAVELKGVLGWKEVDKEDWPCGAHFSDLNRDGRLDLVLTIHHKNARNKVFLNDGLKDGIPQFRDVTEAAGLGTPVPIRCPHVEIQDFDNDGLPDIYTSAAWLDDGKVTPLIYRCTGIRDGIPRYESPRPIGSAMVYYPAGPSGDYDGDGRLDLFLINWFQGNHCRLMHNESTPRRWLDVKVTGKTFNRSGIGSQVAVYAAGKLGQVEGLLGFQELTIGYGYASGQPAVCHFGLGDHAKVDLRVRLPDGKVVDRAGVESDRVLTIE